MTFSEDTGWPDAKDEQKIASLPAVDFMPNASHRRLQLAGSVNDLLPIGIPHFPMLDPVLRLPAWRYVMYLYRITSHDAVGCPHCAAEPEVPLRLEAQTTLIRCGVCGGWRRNPWKHARTAMHVALWPKAAVYMLDGLVNAQIDRKLGHANLMRCWRPQLSGVMHDLQPELAAWWADHFEAIEPTIPAHIQQLLEDVVTAIRDGKGPALLHRNQHVAPTLVGKLFRRFAQGVHEREVAREFALDPTAVSYDWAPALMVWVRHESPPLAVWIEWCRSRRRGARPNKNGHTHSGDTPAWLIAVDHFPPPYCGAAPEEV
ncbi:hypothetical protein [Cupriavidus metallidurans]|uniref:hypothetical protein n=1 Tax=Cupriavidus metallidurans TaxID=119219 RepID=UPI001CCD0D0A|nr:hypothetical protein [Cupriavidus metallidurans]UBM07923.1 hypothetical protein LAI70_09440 [Cupriavidus metallidurans]